MHVLYDVCVAFCYGSICFMCFLFVLICFYIFYMILYVYRTSGPASLLEQAWKRGTIGAATKTCKHCTRVCKRLTHGGGGGGDGGGAGAGATDGAGGGGTGGVGAGVGDGGGWFGQTGDRSNAAINAFALRHQYWGPPSPLFHGQRPEQPLNHVVGSN